MDGAPYPLRYPYETPGLYAPTYPADAAARERLRDEGLKKDGSLVHQVPGALPPAPQDP